MSVLLPGFLLAAGAAALLVAALHFIVTREPEVFELPTARFAPERIVEARARRLELRDVLLLAIRVLLVAAVGAALARPLFTAARSPLTRLILVDRSRSVLDPAEVADSVRDVFRKGDVLIPFDSSARAIESPDPARPDSMTAGSARGRLSAALVVALREASARRRVSDSLELVIVSPLLAEETDAATDSIRALWPAGIRLVAVAPARAPAGRVISLEAEADDPLDLALPVEYPGSRADSVRILRRLAARQDSLWAHAPGHLLVVWPRSPGAPAGWEPRPPDTAGAVGAGGAVVVAPFGRWLRYAGDPRASVSARWVDGEPAAVEERIGNGCLRTVTIDVPAKGDLALDHRFARLVAALLDPCGGRLAAAPLDAAARGRLEGSAPGRAAHAGSLIPLAEEPSPWTRWLLAAALLLAVAEHLLRRRAVP